VQCIGGAAAKIHRRVHLGATAVGAQVERGAGFRNHYPVTSVTGCEPRNREGHVHKASSIWPHLVFGFIWFRRFCIAHRRGPTGPMELHNPKGLLTHT
jgi:hypothetical protein